MERMKWIDNAKGIGIILVVLGHAIIYEKADSTFWNGANTIIYSFHMPLFFFLSAYLQGCLEKNNISYTQKKIKLKLISLAVPYFIFSFVYWLSEVAMSAFVHNKAGFSDLLLCPIFPLSTLWFLYALLCYWFIRVIIYKLKIPNKYILICCALLSVVTVHIGFNSLIKATVIPRLLKNSIYYSVGIEYGLRHNHSRRLGGGTLLLGTVGFTIGNYVLMTVNVPAKGLIGILTALSGILFVCSVSNFLSKGVLSNFGKNSLGIYLMHDYIICFMVIFVSKLISNASIIILLATLFGTIISYIVYLICINNRVLKLIFQPQELVSYFRSRE